MHAEGGGEEKDGGGCGGGCCSKHKQDVAEREKKMERHTERNSRKGGVESRRCLADLPRRLRGTPVVFDLTGNITWER